MKLFPSEIQWQPQAIKHGSVAIIMRTKDRPILLVRAIASVLSQRYENWHLYIVNDGGDVTALDTIIAKHAMIFGDRLTVIHNPISLGMEAASNKALERVTQDYIVVHDDDDSWHPDFLSKTVAFLEAPEHRDYAAVITNNIVIHERIDGDRVIETHREDWGYWRPFVDGLRLLQGNVAPPICLLIRASVVKLIGTFNEDLPVLGDWDYNLRIFREGDIGSISEPLAYYHHRPKDVSQYGNSVIAGIDRHLYYQTRMRNAMLRKLFQSDESSYGVVHVMLASNEELSQHLWRLEGRLHHVALMADWQFKMLRPVRWLWIRLRPLRRVIARLRGRT